jgi:ATP-binding cassette subfamily B protein
VGEVRSPPILILDEATSALDPITKADIIATIERMTTKHSVIIITHLNIGK